MAVKQVDLSKRFKLSKQRISQMVKEGMPLGSFEEAESWRVGHYGGSAIMNQQGGAHKSESVGTGGGDLPLQPVAPNLNDIRRRDLVGVVARLQTAEYEAWQKWHEAFIEGRHNDALVSARHYEAMVKPLISTSEKLSSIQLQEGVTVLMCEVKELIGRHLQPLNMALKNLPARLAARCNPSDPSLAKQTLHEAVVRIRKMMHDLEL